MKNREVIVADCFAKAGYGYYSELLRKIDYLMKTHDIVKVAIDGNCGAGKSTLADIIGNSYECNIFHMDHFFLRPELRTKERLEEVGGNIDYVRFREEVIAGIQSGCEFKFQRYDCKKMAMDECITVLPKKLNIIEGTYSMHPTIIDNYDLKVFLQIDKEEQRERILKRNGEAMLEQFLTKWIPLENLYFQKMKIEEKSDLLFRNNQLFTDNLLNRL